MRKLTFLLVGLCLCGASAPAPAPAPAAAGAGHALKFIARSRTEVAPGSGRFEVAEKPVEWDARRTAVIVCDLWDRHWCRGATERAAAMAPRMNDFVKTVRSRGGLVVHAPSDTMKFYEGTPQRKLAADAPAATPPVPIGGWCHLDPKAEGALPIDDSDGGCDDEPRCVTPNGRDKPYPWTRQHPAVEVLPGDAVSDKGQEVYNLLEQRGVKNVVLLGVHTNMCVLGRPFGIRQMTRLGKNVVLVRDLTDAMYNPRKAPFVPHARGTDLVVAHVEKHWCPTVHSSDVLGDRKPPHVVMVLAEDEYEAARTMPEFARAELEGKLGYRVTALAGGGKADLPGTEAVADADLLVLFMRRRTLPGEQLARFKKHFDAGKPVVAVRTSSHGFQNWLEFDRLVLGGNYAGHHGNGGVTKVAPAPGAETDPVLRGVATPFESRGSLYKVSPLAETAKPLLTGRWNDAPPEPVAWTNNHNGGRVFYTSLGHPEDFKTPAFRRLLTNGIHWALDRPIPKGE